MSDRAMRRRLPSRRAPTGDDGGALHEVRPVVPAVPNVARHRPQLDLTRR
jgi:hypothetical protein